MTETCEGKV